MVPKFKYLGAVLNDENINIIIILTAIDLMPSGSVTKIGRTYKKWTYIARKQNIQLTKKQHVQLTNKQHISQNFTVQYKCNEQNTRYNK
jgi:uncharacterized protein YabE (DUF348 family)